MAQIVTSGARTGARAGADSGIYVPGSTDPMAAVTRDAISGIYCPANATEWAIVLSVAGVASGGPSLLYLCQEPSGNLSDSIGTFTGTASGTPITYSQTDAGWSRKGIGGTDAGTGVFANSSGSLPNPTNSAIFLFGYSKVTSTPAAIRALSLYGSTNFAFPQVDTAPHFGVASGAGATAGTTNPVGQYRPIGLLYDATANNRCVAYSDQEKVTVTRLTPAARLLQMRCTFAGATNYFTGFFDAAASSLTDANVRSIWQTLGWTIPW